ncbi:hypothetical protein PINS_up008932 [Pythium insidiosum]|nr:hypothetical protein PINS_up008932 [Pythium insidiosum]
MGMPPLGSLAVAALLWLTSAAVGELVVLKTELLAANADAVRDTGRVAFYVAEGNGGALVPERTLLGTAPNDADLKCVEQTLRQSRENVTVVIAISQCLNDSSLALIDRWLGAIKRKDLSYIGTGSRLARRLQFVTTLVPGQCNNTSSRAKLAVSASDIERFGREMLPAAASTSPSLAPVAVVSFTNDAASYQQVERYVQRMNVSSTYNFQMCDPQATCEAIADAAIRIETGADLFLYDPFTIVRAVDCDSVLDDGVPVAYVDDQNHRQCFCACPVGSTKQPNGVGKWRCDPDAASPLTCVWEQQQCGDFRIENRDKLETCAFRRLASDHGVPVPFPTDNYVADGRVNSEDDNAENPHNGPHVTLSMAFNDEPVYNRKDLDSIFEQFDPSYVEAREYPATWDEFLELARSFGVNMAALDQSHLVPFWVPTTALTPVNSQHLTWRSFQHARVATFRQPHALILRALPAFGARERLHGRHDVHGLRGHRRPVSSASDHELPASVLRQRDAAVRCAARRPRGADHDQRQACGAGDRAGRRVRRERGQRRLQRQSLRPERPPRAQLLRGRQRLDRALVGRKRRLLLDDTRARGVHAAPRGATQPAGGHRRERQKRRLAGGRRRPQGPLHALLQRRDTTARVLDQLYVRPRLRHSAVQRTRRPEVCAEPVPDGLWRHAGAGVGSYSQRRRDRVAARAGSPGAGHSSDRLADPSRRRLRCL